MFSFVGSGSGTPLFPRAIVLKVWLFLWPHVSKDLASRAILQELSDSFFTFSFYILIYVLTNYRVTNYGVVLTHIQYCPLRANNIPNSEDKNRGACPSFIYA